MQAVLLAAGRSTRTHPLTASMPKPLLKVANKSIICHNLEQLRGIIDEAIIVIGFEGAKIKEALGHNYEGIRITYIEQQEQKGTAHAVLQAKRAVKGRFIAMNADDFYSRNDIKKILSHKLGLLCHKSEHPEHFGVINMSKGKLLEIIEKPKAFISNMVNIGFYLFDDRIFSCMQELKESSRGEFEITDAINLLAKQAEVHVEEAGSWMPITYPWSLLDANEIFLKGIKSDNKGMVEAHLTLKGEIIVGKGTVIKSGSYIEGPVMIGEDCTIGPNCYIRGPTTIGNRCKVGQAVEIKNSILMDDAKVPHLSYVGDSIIGQHSNLGAGTIIANLRHDGGNVKSAVKGELIDTGRRKLGAIIADHVHTGIHTSIYPGRKIWPHKTTLPGEIVTKDVE